MPEYSQSFTFPGLYENPPIKRTAQIHRKRGFRRTMNKA
ncbi:conserved hypothetical protein [delta proteobacterium NaphS2]|nr:conserved hypothetical protein [delta proteobacterium NaphS2]